MKELTPSVYTFEDLILGNYVYVDKTEYLWKLVRQRKGAYFLARPRRFGKSLMLSTLEAIFNVRRNLFEGLAISKTDYDWPCVPVVHLDMSSVLADNIDELKKNIVNMIRRLARDKDVSVDFSVYDTPSSSLAAFIDEMSRKYQVPMAVLIDEYDAPVNRLIESGADSAAVNSLMHDFYVQLKVNDARIRFLMMTGISKFAKLSVFSGLNNLIDLTLEPDFAGLLGYTPKEIECFFSEHIAAFANSTGKSSEEIVSSLLAWYDGYRFSPYSNVRVTNPVSLAYALSKRRFEPFWNETGHSSLIYNHLKNRTVIPAQLNGFVADKSDLDYCDISDSQSPALLFQTGYLTIDETLPDGKLKFKIPNREVAQALTTGMLAFIFKSEKRVLLNQLEEIRLALKNESNKIERVLHTSLTAAFNAIPYDWTIKDEPEARRMFLFYCNLMGAEILAKIHSPLGRADAVLLFPDSVFIFEFKYNHSAQLALKQAEDKIYAGPFMNGNRSVYLIGVNYNSAIRNIDPPCFKKLNPAGHSFHPPSPGD